MPSAANTLGASGISLAFTIAEFVKSNGLKITAGEYKEVNNRTIANPLSYFSPSAWAAITGIKKWTKRSKNEGEK